MCGIPSGDVVRVDGLWFRVRELPPQLLRVSLQHSVEYPTECSRFNQFVRPDLIEGENALEVGQVLRELVADLLDRNVAGMNGYEAAGNRPKHSQSRRSAGRKRRSERARMPT